MTEGMTPTRPLAVLTLAALLCAGCTQFPQLDRTITPQLENAAYPDLVPLAPLVATATSGRLDQATTEADLLGRVARLKARAARLQGSVLTGRERQRLAQGLS
jgi:hypothetical protein